MFDQYFVLFLLLLSSFFYFFYFFVCESDFHFSCGNKSYLLFFSFKPNRNSKSYPDYIYIYIYILVLEINNFLLMGFHVKEKKARREKFEEEIILIYLILFPLFF